MSAAIPVQIGQVIDNKFRIDRVLAQGGMGVLCAATHLHLDQKIAVKFRLAGSKVDATRFIREAQLAVRLQNRHVCRVMDLGYLGEATPYIVMEYLDGNDLAKEVEDRGRLPIDEAVEYILQACDAMAEAHSLGIVHRDLKPENLFLARQNDGRAIVKVLDFGISKQHGVTLTTESDLMGTPAYMAHEQWASAKHVTAASDIYALGATLHFLLTGTPPFHATTIPEMFAKISTQQPPALRTLRVDVPIEIEMLVLRCLARKPDDRPQDVLEISDLLLPFAPGRKRAALSVVGRAFGRSGSAPSTDGVATQPMPAQLAAMATGSPMSTNDLAIGVRSSSDEVAPPRARWRTAVLAIGGLAAIGAIAIAVAVSRGDESPVIAPSGSQASPPLTAPERVVAEPDAAIATIEAAVDPPDAAVASATPPSTGRPVSKPVPPRPRDTPDRPATEPVPAPPDAGVPVTAPADAMQPTPDARCKTDDYRCKFGT